MSRLKVLKDLVAEVDRLSNESHGFVRQMLGVMSKPPGEGDKRAELDRLFAAKAEVDKRWDAALKRLIGSEGAANS